MIGFAICGSFCNFKDTLSLLSEVKYKYKDVLPIMSENARNTDTRFFASKDFYEKVCEIAQREPLCTITQTEPIGPKGLIDLLIICPCTGNTLSKLSCGITDTAVTMAAKSHLRVGGKTVIALSTNDALGGSFESVAKMMNRKNIFFVPLHQDDHVKKPSSLVFIKPLLIPTVEAAYEGKQLQPVFDKPSNE